MKRKCTKICWRRGALRRKISEWHLGVLQSSKAVLQIQSFLNLKKLPIEKNRSIQEGNEESRVEPPIPPTGCEMID